MAVTGRHPPGHPVHGFERAAGDYDDYAVLQRIVGDEMLERLQYVRLQPSSILDAGCGTGHCTRALRAAYRHARVIGLDQAASMLMTAQQKRGWLDRTRFVQADAMQLPVATGSIDLVFSNLMLQWCDPMLVFQEFRRVLTRDGLLMFSSFGPDTLRELREAWLAVDQQPHVIDFVDMHDLGDMLMLSGFREPVMDVDRHTLTYKDVLDLLRDLHGIGSRNIDVRRSRGLMGRGALQSLAKAYQHFSDQQGRLPASYEVVYGHAWSGGDPLAGQDHPGTATVSLDRLRRKP